MAKLGYTHNVDEYETEQVFEPLPVGWYLAHIIDSEIVENKRETGNLLKIKVQILEDKYHGRIVFEQFNVTHKSPEAERIGREQFNHIAKAAGVEHVEDSEDVHNKPFMVRLGIERKEGFEPRNVIKGAKPAGAGSEPKRDFRDTPSTKGKTPTERKRELSSDELAEQEMDNLRKQTAAKEMAKQNGTSSRSTRSTPFNR